MKKLRMVCLGAVMICLGASFLTAKGADAAEAKTKVVFSKSIDTMEQGSSYAFKAKVKNGNAKNVVWKSSNKDVLDINSNGKVKAKAAGEAVVTATVGKASVTEKVMVYPSLNEISRRNEVAANLDAGVYSSILSEKKGEGYSIASAVSKDDDGYTTIVSGSGVTICKGNLKYFYDGKDVSIYTSQNAVSNGISAAYTAFSNEKITVAFDEGNSYHIYTETDIAGLTKEEQKSRTGITDGKILQELLVNKKTGLLEELTYTILYDKEDPDVTYVSHEVFSYDKDNTGLIPKAVSDVINAEKTRTVTIIFTNTEKEKQEIYTLPDTMPLYVPADMIYYKDAACTSKADSVVKHEDGTYDSCIVYIK